MKKLTKMFSVVVSPKLYAKLAELAKEGGCSVAQIVRNILREKLGID